MAVTIGLAAGENFEINDASGGLAFFDAAGFGSSIAVGDWAKTIFISNSSGSVEGARCDCAVPTGTGTASIGGVSYNLRNIPNYLATLRIRVHSDTLINIQNSKIFVYNGTDESVAPTGVTTKVAEIIHPSTTADSSGTGSLSWVTLGASGSALTLVDNPGENSALVGTSTQATDHDHFLCISQSPDAVGSKSSRLKYVTEYL